MGFLKNSIGNVLIEFVCCIYILLEEFYVGFCFFCCKIGYCFLVLNMCGFMLLFLVKRYLFLVFCSCV